MPDEWFLRVQGKEYGPVDLDTLREWRLDGRLIADNDLRPANETEWRKAGEFVELFADSAAEAPGSVVRPDDIFRRRTIPVVIVDAFRIYARGFLPLFGLALLVALPTVLVKTSLAYVHTPEPGVPNRGQLLPAAIATVAITLLLVAWPIFLAGVQFATADIAAGLPVSFRDLLRRATNIWPRMARLSLFVYGSFIFWTALPLVAILSISRSEPTLLSLLLALLALAVQVYMFGRLFINFLFWQQSATIGGLEGADALRDSKELARSRVGAPMLERPMYRGALLASLWLGILLAFAVAVELPFLIVRLQGIATIEDAAAMARNLANAPAPDAMTITTYVLSSLVHALLKPLLGITFVLLYFDAKARR